MVKSEINETGQKGTGKTVIVTTAFTPTLIVVIKAIALIEGF
jgi:hypothetical protein